MGDGPVPNEEHATIAVIGAGAAGLMAAIWAGRTLRGAGAPGRIVALDGARSLGAKILVAGGGRCNVTHHAVDERAFAGSTPGAIRKVLRSFGVGRTASFFREYGVELKQEETGKLFPVTDSARTVLGALLRALDDAGAEALHPWRVHSVEPAPGGGFVVREAAPGARVLRARRIVLATGGRSLPRSGSDGHGYAIAGALGHTVTPRVFPALVPLVLEDGCFVRSLPGVSTLATLEVRTATGKRIVSFTGPVLCAHFGLTGPATLDISRHYTDAAPDGAALVINWLPGDGFESIDAALQSLGRQTVRGFLRKRLPERLADALCREAGIDPSATSGSLPRDARRVLSHLLTAMALPVQGDRGYTYAEVTAGGVPLAELRLESMESRPRPGLHLAGEVLDVDGRIGGFNFQWAWASGYAAGVGAARAILSGG